MTKNLLSSSLFFLFVLLLCPPQLTQAQQKEMPQRSIPSYSFFISGDYFSPKFTDVNAVYKTIEKNYFLPAGSDFKNYYSLMGGIKFSPVEQQSIQAELGASLYKSQLGNSIGQAQSRNFLQMYYAGGTYLINIPVKRISFFVGPGLGYVWLNTQRTYSDQVGVVHVNGGLFQLHGTGGVEFFHPSGVSFSLEGGYSYATTPFPERSDLDFTIQGFMAGIKVTVPLVKSF